MKVSQASQLNVIFAAGIVFAVSWHNFAYAENVVELDEKPTPTRIAQTFSQSTSNTSAASVQQSDPSFNNVLLIADTINTGATENEIIAEGNVEARHQGRKLVANRLIYDRNTAIVKAFGNVIIIEADGTTSFAEEITVDDRLTSGIVSNFAARLEGGATIAARTALRNQGSRSILSKMVYSACEVCETKPTPTWSLRARNAIQDVKSKSISYNDVVFEVKGVPVLWVPYFRHGDPSAGRQSGFLQTKPGSSSRLGSYIQQPYLYVIDDFSDIIIAPQVNRYVNPILFADYRRNFYSGNLEIAGSVTKEKFFGKKGESFGESDWRAHVFADGAFKINENWNWGFGAENASDEFYLYRYGIRGQNLVRGPIRSTGSRLLTQAYLEGKYDNLYTRIIGVKFQDMVSAERRKNTPKVLPNAEITKVWQTGPWDGRLSANGSLLYLDRKSDNQDLGRVSGSLKWDGRTIIGNGVIIEPSAFIRSDFYKYKNKRDALGNNIGDQDFNRNNANASVDIRWPLGKFGPNYSLIVEPRINFTSATTDEKSSLINVEDAIAIENDIGSYFMSNRNSIYDYWDGGSRITLGTNFSVTTKANVALTGFVGKQFRSKDNPFLSRLSNYDRKDGDYVVETNLKYNSNFSMGGKLRLDKQGQLIRSEINSTVNWGRLELAARYQHLSEKIGGSELANEELVTTSKIRINKNVRLFAENWHDFRNNINWYNRAGVLFGDGCTDVRAYYEEINTTNRFIRPSKNFKVEIAFKTLGAIDDEPFLP